MAGMHVTCTFEDFSTQNPTKFESRLTKWCSEIEYMHGRCMLVFDLKELNIINKSEYKPEKIIQDGHEVYKVVMQDISFTYIHIAGELCIMYKIWENITQSVLYNMHPKWDGTELWVGN